MRKLFTILLISVVLLSVGAMAFAAAKTITITYVNFIGKETDQVGATIDTYMKAHPNVKFDYQIVDHTTMQQKYQVMISSNTLPDFFWWNAIWLSQTLQNNPTTLVDLTPYFDPAFKSKFLSGTWNLLATKDGRIAGFPAEMQVQAWMLNKSLFDKYGLKIPTTYEELKACVPVFKKNGIATIDIGTLDPWPTWGFYQWMQLWGIDDQGDDLFLTHKVKTVDAGYAAAFKAIAELKALGAFPDNNATLNFEAMVQMFLAGKAAMISLPSDQLGKIVGQPIEKDLVFNWGINFPNSPYSQKQAIKFVGNGYGVGGNVEKDQDKLKAIVDFNKWRYSNDAFPIALKAGFILPVKVAFNPSSLGPVMKQQYTLINDAMKGTITAAYSPYLRWNTDANIYSPAWGNPIDNLLVSLLNGSMTAADIPTELAKVDVNIDGAIAQLKK
jgi:raffinose/stachyose/melibiose transport system substrate-binding protein